MRLNPILFVAIVLFVFLQSAFSCFSQVTLPRVLLPSPTSSELGKYGDIPINQSTGAVNLSIPLLTYSTQHLSLPVSLSYLSNGFRVNAIASRVGFDWVLNAGGVITRMVFDEPDLDLTTIPWRNPDFSQKDDNLYQYLIRASYDGYDTQPDVFYYNFNGYTGRFIIGNNGEVLTVPHKSLKIEYNFNWETSGFTITTPDGIKYYFGLADATESTRNTSSCGGQHYIDYIANAWYVTKIEHPNGDFIIFDYETKSQIYQSNINQSIYSPADPYPILCSDIYEDISCPSMQDMTCYTNASANVVRLKTISSSANGTLEFNYQSRNDIQGTDGLVSEIIQYNNDHIQLRRFAFEYTISQAIDGNMGGYPYDNDQKVRPFLHKISEFGQSGSLPKVHEFSYNSLNELPPRLCFAQDRYGYYNGITNNNYLVPKPTTVDQLKLFNYKGGNRDADPDYAQKGMLNKVVYPTGGYSQIYYEGHTISGSYTQWVPNWVTTNVQAIGDNTIFDNGEKYVKTETFTATSSEAATLRVAFFSLDGTTDPDSHIKLTASVIDLNTQQEVYSQIVSQNQSLDGTLNVTAGVNYRIKIEFYGNSNWHGSFIAKYSNGGSYDTVPYTLNYPGVRVAKIVSNDNTTTNPPQVKKYYYSKIDNLNGSSLFDYGRYDGYQIPVVSLIQCINGSTGGIPNIGASKKCYVQMLNSSAVNAQSLVSNNVFYTSVLESNGEHFENGGIEYKFELLSIDGNFPLMGNDLRNAPQNNNGRENAELLEQNTFLWRNGQPVYVKKEINTYSTDFRIDNTVKGYAVQQNWNNVIATIPHQESDFACFDVNYYLYKAPWRYLSKTETYLYDQQTQVPILVTTNYNYDNPDHGQLTRIEKTNSKGALNKTVYKYPGDKSQISGLTTAAGSALDAMVQKHIFDKVVQEENFTNGVQLDAQRTDYKIWDNNTNTVFPEKIWYRTGNAAFENRITFYSYDQNYNILEMSKQADATHSYIWGYKNTYPIAEAINAQKNDIAYTSFENDADGNWIIGSALRDPNNISGKQCFNLATGNIKKNGLNSSVEYVVSYWTQNATPFLINGTQSSPVKGRAINGWTSFEHKVTGVFEINIPQTAGLIDELKVYPRGALLSTYTYAPLIGITSKCDVQNVITYYEYDELNRLLRVRDADKNILKQFDYRYQAPIQ